MTWNSPWADRACDPKKRRARLIVEIGTFSFVCAVALCALGLFLYFHTAQTLVAIGLVAACEATISFAEWINDDGCPEEDES